jgi:ribosomal protein L11 methyltransferase
MAEPRYPYVHVTVPIDDVDLVSAELFELLAQGVEERDATTMTKGEGDASSATLVASFAEEADAAAAIEALEGRYPAHLEHVVGDRWADEWKRFFKPIHVGRLWVRPSWEPVEPAGGEVVLTLDPGRAFGSGLHETTQLVLGAIEGGLRGGERILDVGCGSGILGIAAILLGASKVTSIDVDPSAIEVTRENAVVNGVEGRIEASTLPVDGVRDRFPWVLANIEARVLVPMAEALAATVEPGGMLVLSGILVGQEDEVRAAYPSFEQLAAPVAGEWVSLVMRRPTA